MMINGFMAGLVEPMLKCVNFLGIKNTYVPVSQKSHQEGDGCGIHGICLQFEC